MRRVFGLALSTIIALAFPVIVFAQSGKAATDTLFTSDIFQKFDVKLISDIGLILPIIVAWFAIKVAYLMRGGKLEQVWKLIAAGMSVLAIMKVIDGLEDLDILSVAGLRSILEFVMILVFLAAFLTAYQSLVAAIRGPIPVESPKIDVPGEKKEEEKVEEKKEEGSEGEEGKS